MAVAPTGNAFKALSFDNVSSRSYGVYITGEAVYNAPERDVEMISIPGRNGQFALDKGRFENIEVTYPAGIFAQNETDFANAISDFRNFLCSRDGYVRLTDEYNPNEYRMAIYKSGLEVEPAMLRAGEFEITFDCKPQRFLTSGETASTVSRGGTLTNPTLFESSPLLQVEGYGTININGYSIGVIQGFLGEVQLLDTKRLSVTGADTALSGAESFNPNLVLTGNTITVTGGVNVYHPNSSAYISSSYLVDNSFGISSVTYTNANIEYAQAMVTGDSSGKSYITQSFYANPATFTKGTSGRFDALSTALCSVWHGNQTGQVQITINLIITYNGNDLISISVSKRIDTDTLGLLTNRRENQIAYKIGTVIGDSTLPLLGHPTYIDCDLGEVYKIENGTVISLNRYVDLGPKLPVLAVGNSTVTYSNTITSLKVAPRWWKV